MNELETLIGLQDELLTQLDVVLRSGRPISEQWQTLIGDQLQWLQERIEQLSQEPTAAMAPNPAAEDLQEAMPSSNIEGFAYDDKSGSLLVRFLGKHPNRYGPIYAYEGVPKVIFELFKNGSIPARTDGRNAWGEWWKGKVPSIGASMYTLIKQGGYPYERVS